MRHTSLIAILLITALVPAAQAATITVDWRGGADYETIQGGLDAAGDGDEVLVADGTYSGPDNTELDFHGKSIHLRRSGTGEVLIDCEQSARAFLFDDGEDELAIVDGLTVVNGASSTGGAIRIVDASPTITNCTIESCTADERGGGIRVVRGHPVIDSCVFIQNHAVEGGAIAVEDGAVTIRHCSFSSNEGDDLGGALLLDGTTVVVQDCSFTRNETSTSYGDETSAGGAVHILGSQADFISCDFEQNVARKGGAISLRRPSSVSLSACSFYANRAGTYTSIGSGYGAAVHMYGCSPTISECYFERNEPTGGGTIWGEYSSPVLDYCTFFSNKGALETDIGHDIELYHTDIDNAVIENCTFCGWRMNGSRDEGALLRFGDCEPLVEGCIIAFYNYGPGVTCIGTGQPTIRECIVFGNTGGDEICGTDPSNNLSTDPLFCGFWEGDLTLCANSPCLPPYNPWGILIGAHDAGCESCDTPVERTSWGTIKAMYR